MLRRTFDLIAEFCNTDNQVPVGISLSPQEISQSIPLELEEQGMNEDSLMQLLSKVMAHTPRTGSKRFYNQLFAGRNSAALAGELLTAAANNSVYTYKVGGVHILIEREVLGMMLQRVGFTNGWGVFCPGGSLSNMVGMLLARQKLAPELIEQGGGTGWVIYTSEEGHYSIHKNAGFIGLGRQNVRPLGTDEKGRISIPLLEQAVRQDQEEGRRALLINGTAGTTVHGAFDDLRALRKIADAIGCWLHIDAAYGGSLLMSPQYRDRLAGIEMADSVTWDAHKMMGVPLLASVILTSHKDILNDTLMDRASYLFQQDADDYNPGLISLQCGRRNDALKLWCLWKRLGHLGYARYIEHLLHLTEYAVQLIKEHPRLSLALEPQCTTLCFMVDGKDSKSLCASLDEAGEMKVGYGNYKGQNHIRLAIANPDLTENDIKEALNLIAEKN